MGAAATATYPLDVPSSGDGWHGGHGTPDRNLRLVPPRPSSSVYWRRRAVVMLGLGALVLLMVGLVGQIGASADLADQVDGHVVIEPGETLWDVAVATAPDGTDARAQLAAIEELNGIRAHEIGAWKVVLLPAR